MKKRSFKKVMLSIGAFLFATCLGLGVGMLKTPVQADSLGIKNDFSGLDTSLSTGGIDTVTVGAAADNYLVVNKALGGSNGINVDIAVNVTFMQEANYISLGMLPTNNKDDIAVAKKDGNSFAGADYDFYYFTGEQYKVAYFKDNGWAGDSASTVQTPIVGQVTLKLSIGAYSNHSLHLYVPSSNTQMDASVARNEWIELGSEGFGLFVNYAGTNFQASGGATGYAFFCMQNVVYNNISITPGAYSPNSPSLNDNFSDPSTFATNYVTNDAFDNGVASGNIILPKASIAVSTTTTTDITTNHNSTTDMFRSTQSFNGAMRAEMSVSGIGPTARLGFYSLTNNANVFVRMGLQGVSVNKYGEDVYNVYGGVAQTENWATILNESGAGAMGGEFKIIFDVNAQGDTTVSLQVVKQTYGQTLTKSLYEITTINELCADIVTGGGYLVFCSGHSDWGNQNTIQGVTLTNAKGEVLVEDDFSCNNVNDNGAKLWMLTDTAGLYNLPGENAVTFDGGTAYVNAQNTATAKEKLTVEWNAQVSSGEMKYYLGMSEKETSMATAYVTVKDGNLTFSQDETVTLAEGVDFTAKTLVKLVFNNAHNKVYAFVNGEQTGVADIREDLTGYMGIYATNAKMTYLAADITEAFNVVDMQAGAYLKANTTLQDSGIRFATIIDKDWYDETIADTTVSNITYGTLIVPTDYLAGISAFTLEGLQASGKNYINAVVSSGFTNEDTAEVDGYYQFMGGIKNILPANYTRNFSAVGYVTVTYTSGAVETNYTAYRAEDHSRNIYQLAERTYGDRSTIETTQYIYKLKDGTWAKYSQEVMDVMYAYLDGVVNVTVGEDGKVSNVTLNEYYQASYNVTYSGNVFTVESDTEVKTILVNGIRQKNFTKGMNGEKYTATFTFAGIFDTQTLFATETEVTEVSLAGLADYSNIKAYTYKSVAYGGLETTNPFMAVGIPTASMPEGGYPAIILVHGGAGQVYCDWIKHWTDKGYVALALDMFGNMLNDSLQKVVNPLGGPNEYHSGSLNDNPYDYQNSWVYHSVTNVVLCHNYLRSLSNVNADKIGVTGISWGGYITNIVSGVDNRFSAFAPVYGSGYAYDDTKWAGSAFGGENRQAWIDRFDPSSYVKFNAKPTLYVSGIDDNCFALHNRVKTYALAQGDVYFSQRSDLAHGDYWNQTQEIYYFMEKVLNGATDDVTGFVNASISNDGVNATVTVNNYANVKDKITSVNFVYSTSTDADTHAWTFTTVSVSLDANGTASVEIPVGATAFNFEFVMTMANYRLSTAIIMA